MSEYDELADRAERGQLPIKPGTTRRGAAAREAGRKALLEATGADGYQEAARVALGRPSLGNEGSSPVVRARVPHDLKRRVEALAAQQQRRESEIVRDAVTAYVDGQAPA